MTLDISKKDTASAILAITKLFIAHAHLPEWNLGQPQPSRSQKQVF